jgi:cellulose synthase operon protein YhjQ
LSIVAIVSMKGGVGKTSTTANLAAAIAESLGEGRVSALDLDPQNSLHLHFGLDTTGKGGICTESLQNGDWRNIALASAFGVTCLPYGMVSEPEREAFETLLDQQPDWIGTQLARAGFDGDGVVMIDTPPGPSVYLRQAFACADLVVIVLLADAGSFVTIPAMEAWVHDMVALRPDLASVYVLNQVDSASPLRRDVAEVLRSSLGARLAPIGIHCDEAVSEALAFQQPVLRYDPHGQATQDLYRLAEWLMVSPKS